MFERILVPLDGSKIGEAALPVIEELVTKLLPDIKVEVTLFHAVSYRELGLASMEAPQIIDTDKEMRLIIAQAIAYLSKAAEGLRRKGVIVKTRVGSGPAAQEIIKAADEINAELIVMLTHGRSGFSRFALGSVADKVLRVATTPILLVRATKQIAQT
jgi:nucleotide-binding universal stress UspA family protein